ncbi:Acyl-CoA N-acyltransferase [Venustampulla echinocandica]|uniref:Acyl-CoA N-acyltransferase n=1 Tax=Venustampulla echinocandica TaxID=2656787 RepID=A0A370TZ18_9HELO|nr:Acyl-CoA N-acyltransferase [Venustampulla echinocandica]RDL40766.1 Acyl-CoA N-acyltransferase [Venustampulla echinocandica]
MAGEISITVGGKDRVKPAAALFAKAFEDDPMITYLLCTMTDEKRIAYLPEYFERLATAASLNGASFPEAEDWKACGGLIPPGKRVDNFWTLIPAGFASVLWNVGFSGCMRMLREFTPLADACKEKGLAGCKDYYYVFLVATREDARGKGLCSAIIRYWQETAAREGVPIWLEATTEHSMHIYSKCGFKIVEEMVIGKGKAGRDGKECVGGEGFKFWGMVWWPDEKKS